MLALLESLDLASDGRAAPLRFPVQWVARHDGDRKDDFRGYAGRVASGVLRLDLPLEPLWLGVGLLIGFNVYASLRLLARRRLEQADA